MSDVQIKPEILQKWKYSVVDNGQGEIRRYREWIYTRWQNGKYVGFFNLADGFVLFNDRQPTVRCDNTAVPFYVAYYGTKKEYQNLAGGDGDFVDVIDLDGVRINCYVDMYNDVRKYSLCDKNNNVLDDNINLAKYHLKSYIKNDYRDEDLQRINDDYEEHSKILDDVEYTYLESQLLNIQSRIDEGLDTLPLAKLKSLKEQVTMRMSEIRPPIQEENKSTGFFGFLKGGEIDTRNEMMLKRPHLTTPMRDVSYLLTQLQLLSEL
jgi:hypothetical protein